MKLFKVILATVILSISSSMAFADPEVPMKAPSENYSADSKAAEIRKTKAKLAELKARIKTQAKTRAKLAKLKAKAPKRVKAKAKIIHKTMTN